MERGQKWYSVNFQFTTTHTGLRTNSCQRQRNLFIIGNSSVAPKHSNRPNWGVYKCPSSAEDKQLECSRANVEVLVIWLTKYVSKFLEKGFCYDRARWLPTYPFEVSDHAQFGSAEIVGKVPDFKEKRSVPQAIPITEPLGDIPECC